MKYLVYIIACNIIFFSSLNVLSQSNENISTRDRIYYGGNFGLVLGTFSQIEISPYIGYRITAPWSVGTGIIFQYYGSSSYYGKYSTAIYGSNIFTKYTIVRDFPTKNVSIFGYLGYEALSLENKYFNYFDETGRFLMHSALVGGGIRQYLGGRASMELLILYNTNNRTPSPYSSPVIRIGLNF